MRRVARTRGPVSTRQDDGGFGLAEVLVAMFVFALISVGVLHTLTTSLTVNRDARARQVAANLAAQEIDRAREVTNLFDLLPTTFAPQQVGTDTYHVVRHTEWVSDPGADFECGASSAGSALRYKRITISVTWDGMRPGTEPVRSDTILDPDERINEPGKGTILVSVLNGQGLGTAGVSVTAQKVSASGTLIGSPLTPTSTDSQGCAYLLRVDPGNYRVAVSKSTHVNTSLEATPTKQVGVDAGGQASAAFEYDEAATVQVRYAANSPEPGPKLPTGGMDTTFAATAGYSNLAGTGTDPRRFTVYPFASGYEVFAGRDKLSAELSTTCKSVNPANWPDTGPLAKVAAGPGSTVALDVPMGVVAVDLNSGPGTSRHLKAVNVDPAADSRDPGCRAKQTLTFGSVLDNSGRAVVAVPYGTWKFTRGSASSQTTTIRANQVIPLTHGQVTGTSDHAVTLDPREP